MYIVFTLLLDGPIGASLWDGTKSYLDNRRLNVHIALFIEPFGTNKVSTCIDLIPRNLLAALFLTKNMYFLLFLQKS